MELNKYFDHTLLKPESTSEDVDRLIEQGLEHSFFSLCIQPSYVKYVKDKVQDEIKIATVIGFPLGANTTEVKVFETMQAIENGADEIDMVINVGALKEQRYDEVEREIAAIKRACVGRVLKVILEISLLTDEEIIKACQLSEQAGADFVKTSTGFSSSGATVEAVRLMSENFSGGVKASGGIRTLTDTLSMIEAGATRIGASASVEIVKAYNESK